MHKLSYVIDEASERVGQNVKSIGLRSTIIFSLSQKSTDVVMIVSISCQSEIICEINFIQIWKKKIIFDFL